MNLAFLIFLSFIISILIIYFIGRRQVNGLKIPYTFKCPDKRSAFERWQDHQIKQMGTASNTLFTLASAALGYSFTLLNNQVLVANNRICIRLFIGAFALSFLFGILSIFNRLEDFRRTKKRHKLRDQTPDSPELHTIYRITRQIGVWTWGFLYAQGFFFVFGVAVIMYFWLINYGTNL